MTSDKPKVVGSFVSLLRGTTYKGSLLGDKGPYLLGLASIQRNGGFRSDNLKRYSGETSEKLLLYPGDIFVSLKDVTQSADLLGAVARVPKEISLGRLTQDTVKLIFDGKEINQAYLYWLLRTPDYRNYCKNHATGTTNLGLSRDDFLNFTVPELNDIRQLVVNALENIEFKIELNCQINQTLEQIAQTIFKSWFVDFEPVKAKIEAKAAGRDPERTAMCAISGKSEPELGQLPAEQYQQLAATAALFPNELVESELGLIPKGWQVKRIKDAIKRFPVGEKYSQKTASEKGIVPILDQGKSGVIGYHNNKPGINASPDDPIIVFANHTCYMRLIMHDFSAIQNVLPFKGNGLNIYWIYSATIGKQEFIEYKGHWPDFETKDIVIPSEQLDQAYGDYVQALFHEIFSNDTQINTLANLRDSLLPKLLSGEIEINDMANGD